MLRRRILVPGLLWISAASAAFGHYHWSYFAHKAAPYVDIPLKYDLAALQSNTIPFFISKTGPSTMLDGDSFPSLVSQIRRAAESWNAVPSSALRVQFGGLVDFPDKQPTAAELVANNTTPSVEVYFDDEMPPGILALTWPQTREDLSYLAVDGTAAKPNPGFAPLLKARIQLRSDLAASKQGSYSDDLFMTIVHEFGHSLGLQHSTTSSAMSTSITRATSKAQPLAADDVAGISWLYPAADYVGTSGSITGRITSGSASLNLASVVALSTNGSTAINTMTNPDGSYKLEGLPPGEYYLYAHPLPPAQLGEGLAAGIVPQTVLDGKVPETPFPAGSGFETRFFPGTRDWTQAAKITVKAGQLIPFANLDLPQSTTAGVYNMRMFADFSSVVGSATSVFVHAPPVPSGFRNWMVFKAPGTAVSGAARVVPNLRLSVIGGPANLEQPTLQYWAGTDDYLLIVASAKPVTTATNISVAVTTDAGVYVLPAAFSVVPSLHPVVTKVADAGVPGAVQIEGVNLTAATRILFDGVDAASVSANEDGSLTAIAPAATGAQSSAVEAYTASGQTSGQLLNPPIYTYAAAENASILSSLGELIPGTDMLLRVDGVNTSFIENQLGSGQKKLTQSLVGFGSSDVIVKQVWVVSPSQLLLNVATAPAAKAGPVNLTVATGLQLVTLPAAVQVRTVSDVPLSLKAPILNVATGLSGAPVGAVIALRLSGLPGGFPDDLSAWRLTIGGVSAAFTRAGPTELRAVVPQLDPGAVTVRLISPIGAFIPSVLLQVDAAPPIIMLIGVEKNASLKDFPLAAVNSHVTVNLEGLGADLALLTPDLFQIRVGGVLHAPDEIKRVGPTGVQLGFTLSSKVPADTQQPLTVGLGTRVTSPRTLAVAAAVAP